MTTETEDIKEGDSAKIEGMTKRIVTKRVYKDIQELMNALVDTMGTLAEYKTLDDLYLALEKSEGELYRSGVVE